MTKETKPTKERTNAQLWARRDKIKKMQTALTSELEAIDSTLRDELKGE